MITITHQNMHFFCRTCLAELNGKSMPMCEKYSIQEEYLLEELITMFTPLPQGNEIKYPDFVCRTCYEKLQSLYDFRCLAMHSHTVLCNIIKGFSEKKTSEEECSGLDSGQGSEDYFESKEWNETNEVHDKSGIVLNSDSRNEVCEEIDINDVKLEFSCDADAVDCLGSYSQNSPNTQNTEDILNEDCTDSAASSSTKDKSDKKSTNVRIQSVNGGGEKIQCGLDIGQGREDHFEEKEWNETDEVNENNGRFELRNESIATETTTRSPMKLQNCIENTIVKIQQDPSDFPLGLVLNNDSRKEGCEEIDISNVKLEFSCDVYAVNCLGSYSQNSPNTQNAEDKLNEDCTDSAASSSTKHKTAKKLTKSPSQSVNEGGEKIQCEHCPRRCVTGEEYEAHLRRHQGLKPFLCKKCGRSFSRSFRYVEHMSEAHGPTALEYICSYEGCGEVFQRKGTYQQHYRRKHRAQQTLCGLNNMKMFNENKGAEEECSGLSSGQKSEDHVVGKECNVTDEILENNDRCGLRNQSTPTETATRSPENLLDCIENTVVKILQNPSACPVGLVLNSDSRKEVSEEIQEKEINISDVKVTSSSPNTPNTQNDEDTINEDCTDSPAAKKTRKSRIQSVNGGGEKIQCEQCPRRCVTWEGYEAHLRTHQGLKPFLCKECGCSFSWARSYREHMREVHGPVTLQFICSYEGCGKVFQRENSYQQHYRYKHKCSGQEYPFKCEECGKRFRTNTSFKNHQLRHAGVKQFLCPHCGVKKTTKPELKTHINHHTKEKQWSCSKCTSVFSSQSSLNRHNLSVHEGKRCFACKHCDKSFAKWDILKRHERLHTGDKPHGCNICGKRFLALHLLRTHMRVHKVLVNE